MPHLAGTKATPQSKLSHMQRTSHTAAAFVATAAVGTVLPGNAPKAEASDDVRGNRGWEAAGNRGWSQEVGTGSDSDDR
jgi:hypothetical protein